MEIPNSLLGLSLRCISSDNKAVEIKSGQNRFRKHLFDHKTCLPFLFRGACRGRPILRVTMLIDDQRFRARRQNLQRL